MTFSKPKLTSRATAEGRIEAVKIEFDFRKWREWKEWQKNLAYCSMDIIVNNHYHVQNEEVLKKLDHINKKLDTMSKELDDIKAKLVTSNEKIDIITTSTDGIKLDLASIKAKLEANAGGIDAAGVAELNTLVDAGNARLADAATALSDLDAETDPNA